MPLKFGTDGVRGDTRSDLTTHALEVLGRAGAEGLGVGDFAVGRDPRESGPEMAEALMRGVEAAGCAPVDLGVLPTPAVARWCADEQVPGAMVSASHNPWHDNGVKFFTDRGYKLDDAAQRGIERRLGGLDGAQRPGAPPAKAPRVDGAHGARPARRRGGGSSPGWRSEGSAAGRRYAEAVVGSLSGRSLEGLHIVADCANGAVSRLAPECLRRLGADVDAVNADPDGRNINNGCGSLHPEGLQAEVVARAADAGLAFDGDADRVLAVDHSGDLIDGDQILAVCAVDRQRRGCLRGGGVVVTVMANLGLRRAMAAHGIAVEETPVGDRHVLDALAESGFTLGGEQSGHLIFSDLATTGDGLLTAVQFLDVAARSRRRLRDLVGAAMTRLPQVLVNVPAPDAGRGSPEASDGVLDSVAAVAAERLGDRGRVLIRPSGTEPVVRVMVEADDETTARAEAESAAAGLAAALG